MAFPQKGSTPWRQPPSSFWSYLERFWENYDKTSVLLAEKDLGKYTYNVSRRKEQDAWSAQAVAEFPHNGFNDEKPICDVVGDSGVGKSCLVDRFVKGAFREDYQVGGRYHKQEVTFPAVDKKDCSFYVWDDLYQGYVQATLVVYDITNPQSFSGAKTFVRQCLVKEKVDIVALVGSKADLSKHRKVKYEDAQAYAERKGILFMEVSAKTGMSVDSLLSKIGLMMVSRFLPEQLRHLPVVDLSYGGFELTPYITSKTLSMLNLSHNGLVALPEAIGDLSSLTHLFVSDNYLSFLPATLKRLKHLRVLDLRNNQLQELLNDIIDLSFLERLSVKGNPLAVEEIRKLMELTDKREGFTVDAAAVVPIEIQAQGQGATLIYEKALRDGYVNVYRGRIFIIGPDRAGKTSLKKSLLGLPFDPTEESTVGIDPSTCEIDVDRVQNWHSKSENSTFFPEVSRYLAKEGYLSFFRKAEEDIEVDGEMFSDDGSDDVLNQMRKSADSPKEGYMQDEETEGEDSLLDRDYDPSYGATAVKELQLPVDATLPSVEVSKHANEYLKQMFLRGQLADHENSKEDSIATIDVWDFAGQHLYYATHPVFLSPRGLYVLVHNLSKRPDACAEPCVRQGVHDIVLENLNGETNIENLLSWLVTIHRSKPNEEGLVDNSENKGLPYHRPPVIIVGTHADKPFEDINAMTSQIQRKISGKEYEKHVIRPFFNIDNTQRSGEGDETGRIIKSDDIDELRAKIMEVLRQEPYMGEKIPIRWTNFEKVIKALVQQKNHHTSVEQLLSLASEICFIDDVEEFNVMLNFYHDLGVIIKHRSTVVLDSKWLIDLFRQLITIPRFDNVEPRYSKTWKEVQNRGIFSMELLNDVFSKFIEQSVAKEDILDFMEQFGLIGKFTSSDTDPKYFVPAQLKTPPEDVSTLEPSSQDPCPLYLHFVDGFVPHGLFTWLVSRSISWCSRTWQTPVPPNLYHNGAWFVICWRQLICHFTLLCKKNFIKIVLRQNIEDDHDRVSEADSVVIPGRIREFIEDTLQKLSRELSCLSGLQYELCVACPSCLAQCSNHRRVSCTDEECLHLVELKDGQPLICMKSIRNRVQKVPGKEKWFSLQRCQVSTPRVFGTSENSAVQFDSANLTKLLNITLLGSEWGSTMGGLSTINRKLAIELAKQNLVNVTLLVPQFACSEDDKRKAAKENITIREAESRPGYDPLDYLILPPRDLAIDVVLGHGAKLGRQAQFIRESHKCKWVQVVHTAPEELGMFKTYPGAICKGEEKNRAEVDLCSLANLVVAVGPKLTDVYSSCLRFCKKDIIPFTPGTFHEFSTLEQASKDGEKFKVLTFGRCDSEDFSLKGYDIAAKAVAELNDRSYCLLFVGAPIGKQDEVAEHLLQTGIAKGQLSVRAFVQSKARLKELFCEVDLAIMPSRIEGFGLTALEALSAGLPILVTGNSGFAHALRVLPHGNSFVVDSDDPKEWAKAIAAVRQKGRAQRLQEIQILRSSYEQRYSWEDQCGALVEKMWSMVKEDKQVSQIPLEQNVL